MRPDAERAIATFIETLRRRTLMQHACEALLAGALAALLLSLVFLRHLTAVPLTLSAAVALGLGGVAWIWLRRTARDEPALVSQTEARQPALRNLLVTARELTHTPDRGRAYIRERVQRDAARILDETEIATLIPRARLSRPLVGAVILTALVAAIALRRDRLVGMGLGGDEARSRTPAGSAAAHAAGADGSTAANGGDIHVIRVTVTPPAYVGRPSVTLVDPSSIDALAGSRVTLSIDASAPRLEREFAGARQPLTRVGTSQPFTDTIVAQETGVLTLTAMRDDGGGDDARRPKELTRRLIAVAVTPDRPPSVRLARPAKDLLLPDKAGSVTFEADATDDVGLDTLTLHYTKVTGSGERYEFTEGELPFTVAQPNARAWKGDATRTVASLDINEGDTLVYYAAATDRRPGQSRAVSDSYVIEIGQVGAAIAGGFAIPPDEEKATLSLNALIQKTEKLHAQRDAMAKAAFTESALGLAIEQRMVRTQFLLSMGSHGHVQDEVEEAEHSEEIQEGRLHNERHAAMNMAISLLTRAETQLTAAETGPALQAQRAALAAVQRARSQQRYFLRTLSVGGQIDQTRRLTGDLSDAKPSDRPEAAPADSTETAVRAKTVRDLLQTLATLARGAGGRDPAARGERADQARAAAGRLLAIDPASADIRTASDRLLTAARELDAGREEAARPLIQETANALLPLARDTSTPAAATMPSPDRALRGATIDALRRTGGARRLDGGSR